MTGRRGIVIGVDVSEQTDAGADRRRRAMRGHLVLKQIVVGPVDSGAAQLFCVPIEVAARRHWQPIHACRGLEAALTATALAAIVRERDHPTYFTLGTRELPTFYCSPGCC